MGGDDRYVGNIFLGGDPALAYGADVAPAVATERATAPPATTGTRRRSRTTSRSWPTPPAATTNDSGTSSSRCTSATTSTPPAPRPSRPSRGRSTLDGSDVTATVVDEGAEVYLDCHLPVAFDAIRVDSVSGSDLERVRFVDADFEEPDGTPVVLTADLVGAEKTSTDSYPPGPLTTLTSGSPRIRVW